MFAYLDRELVILDIEFTDQSEELFAFTVPEITEIAGIRVAGDLTVLDRFESLVRPKDISKQTDQLVRGTGITHDMLESAKPWKEVWKQWAEFAGYNKTRLASWHAYEDVRILRASYHREKLGYPHTPFILDVASMSYAIFSYLGVRPKSWGLANVCTRLEIEQENHHRAMPDAEVTLRILERLQSFEEYFLGGKDVDGNSSRG